MSQRRRTPVETENVESAQCSMELRHELLGGVPFFASLGDAEIAEVNRHFREQGYGAGETIYAAGQRAQRLYVVAVGKVKLLRHTALGQDVLLDILAPGDLFGSLAALGRDEYEDTAQAQTTCCVLAIAAEDFQVLLERYPSMALAVLEFVARRLRATQETVRQLSGQPAESRVAAALLKLAEKLGEEHEGACLIQVPLSREDLAGLTGTTVETASRVMSQLRREGVVRSGRRWVAIQDRQRLEALAEGEDRLDLSR